MKNINKYIAIVSIGLFSVTCMAQEDDGPSAYVYGTYFVCDQATQGEMDDVIENNDAAVFDKWVEDGKLLSWGYYTHFTGGRWRRLQYHVSPTMEDALNNQAAIFGEVYSDNQEAGQARSAACRAHDDYVWAVGQGSGPADARSAVAMSTYHICKITGEQRADEIFAQTSAPKLNELVENGDLSSWSWNMHRIGGKYRRMLTMSGADFPSIVAANGAVIRHVNENHSELGKEFSGICGSHTDYLWNIVH